MKNERIVITKPGAPAVLQLISEDFPDPAPGEVCVRVLASGVAFGDILKRRGLIPGMPKIPYTPGYDLVGVVEKAGAGVDRFQPGQRVAAFVANGAHTRFVNLQEKLLVPVPEGVETSRAVALILNYVTAWQLLHRVARVEAGQAILVHGAAGGAGTALLQLGRLAGLKMLGTASRQKHGLVLRLGATPIDYKREDFVARTRETLPSGVDAVFDPVGGKHLWRSHQALTKKGLLVLFGLSSSLEKGRGEQAYTLFLLTLLKFLRGPSRVHFYGIGHTRGSNQSTINEDLAHVLSLAAKHEIDPVIGATLRLEEAAKAHALLEESAVAGKIVLVHEA